MAITEQFLFSQSALEWTFATVTIIISSGFCSLYVEELFFAEWIVSPYFRALIISMPLLQWMGQAVLLLSYYIFDNPAWLQFFARGLWMFLSLFMALTFLECRYVLL